jgi:hypothetical protein
MVLLMLTNRLRAPDAAPVRERTSAPLLWLESLPRLAKLPPEPATPARARARPSSEAPPIDQSRGTELLAPVPAAPRIDWEREAERVGRTGGKLLTPDTRRCDDSDRP